MSQRKCAILTCLAGAILGSTIAYAQTSLTILLPEKTRLLQDQRVDLVVELRGAAAGSNFKVTANGADITSKFLEPTRVDLDCNGTQDLVYRANLVGFADPGAVTITASVTADGRSLQAVKAIDVRPFSLASKPRNAILFIGDAMGTAYRDAGRLVARSVESAPGVGGFREGFFDKLQEMDRMPVSGMVMT